MAKKMKSSGTGTTPPKPPEMSKEYTFTLTIQEAQGIIFALKKLPMEQVEGIVIKMDKQFMEQNKPVSKVVETPVEEVIK